jgi:hypothetical protein
MLIDCLGYARLYVPWKAMMIGFSCNSYHEKAVMLDRGK